MDFERHHETEALLRDRDEDLAHEDVKRLWARLPRYAPRYAPVTPQYYREAV
jgi:hypothetical protein